MALAVLTPIVTPPVALAEEVCATVERAIDLETVATEDPRTLLSLAPHVSAHALSKLIARTRAGNEDIAFAAFIAVGLSRHGDALKVLREAPAPSRTLKLGRSLGLLALGDGVDTATIARALSDGAVRDRRRVAWALAHMKQRRPQILLYDALEDEDDEVRLLAARALIKVGLVRPRRVLIDLARSPQSSVQQRALRALRKSGGSVRDEAGAATPDERIRELIEEAQRNRRSGMRVLADRVRTQDPYVRAAAHAAVALLGLEGPAQLKRVEKTLAPKGLETAVPEAIAALALLADPASFAALGPMDRDAASRVIAVLYAYARAEGAELEPEHAGQLARIVEAWMVAGKLQEDDVSRAIRAMSRLDPISALLLSRKRLGGNDGRALRSAVRVMGRGGSLGDVSELLDAARRFSPSTRALALLAAARACAR